MNESEPALELFRNACGLKAPLALEYADAGQSLSDSAARVFDCPFVMVGRDPRSDLVLDNGQISRRHAFLQVVEGRIFVVDLQSRTKVFWEGEETPRSQGWLDSGRFIQVGPYRIRRAGGDSVEHQRDDPAKLTWPSEQAQGVPDPLPRAALELPIRMGEGAPLWALDGSFMLAGRDAECQLVLTDESVSRIHAALVVTPLGVWVVDLLAREGVYVNGVRVRWAWIANGDSLRFGRLAFVLRYDVAPDRLSRELVPLEAGASAVELPGTELAVSHGDAGDDRNALAVRPGARSPALRNAVTSPGAGERATLIPSGPGDWEQPIHYAPQPMALWQQQMQMMESFHNDMVLMVQMFVAMHREHMTSFRDELDRIQKLTRELTHLQAKLAQPSGSSDVGLTSAINKSSGKRGSVLAPQGKKSDNNSVSPESKNARGRAEPKRPKTGENSEGPGPEPRRPKEVAMTESGQTFARDDAQVHAILTEHIAALQRERQGYWQRILSALHH